MSEERYTAEEQALFDRELERTLRAELPNVREEEIKAAAQRAAALEVEQHREALRDQLDSEVSTTTAESAVDLREEANREVPSKLLIGLIGLVLLLFFLAVSGRLPGFGRARDGAAADRLPTVSDGTLSPVLGGEGPLATPIAGGSNGPLADSQTGRANPDAGSITAPNALQAADPNINPLFVSYYLQHDGLRIFGRPLSPLLNVNGRQLQWFERTRLEYWPEYAGTQYEVQSGLVGVEYTDGRDFPTQIFFTSRPGLRFFAETSHGVGGKFLEYWEIHGGLDTFGYPISDEVIEILPETKQYHTVQYFQRARFELHPALAGTADEVQLGLLGRALYLNEEKSIPVPAVAPTPVPLP